MVKVEFIKAFASKKKGDIGKFDSQLASKLVRQLKVAKYLKAPAKEEAAKKKPVEKAK